MCLMFLFRILHNSTAFLTGDKLELKADHVDINPHYSERYDLVVLRICGCLLCISPRTNLLKGSLLTFIIAASVLTSTLF